MSIHYKYFMSLFFCKFSCLMQQFCKELKILVDCPLPFLFSLSFPCTIFYRPSVNGSTVIKCQRKCHKFENISWRYIDKESVSMKEKQNVCMQYAVF